MGKLTEDEERFLVSRTTNSILEILEDVAVDIDEEVKAQRIRDALIRAYQRGYSHASDDRTKMMEEKPLND